MRDELIDSIYHIHYLLKCFVWIVSWVLQLTGIAANRQMFLWSHWWTNYELGHGNWLELWAADSHSPCATDLHVHIGIHQKTC